MADLSEFKRGQIVGADMAGTSVIKTIELFGVVKSTVLKVMTVFEEEEKTSSLKQNSGRKRKLSDRDHRTLRWIVRKDYKNTALKIIAELNDHHKNPISTKTLKRELYKAGFHRRAAIRINLFEISRCFHYFVQPQYIHNHPLYTLFIYIGIYIYIYILPQHFHISLYI